MISVSSEIENLVTDSSNTTFSGRRVDKINYSEESDCEKSD